MESFRGGARVGGLPPKRDPLIPYYGCLVWSKGKWVGSGKESGGFGIGTDDKGLGRDMVDTAHMLCSLFTPSR